MRLRLYDLPGSRRLFEETARVIPGGVGSNDRSLVDPHPIFIDRGTGAYLFDVDGNRYIDYLLGYGPLVLGHAHPAIVSAIVRQASRGTIFGAGHQLELEVAQLVTSLLPSVEMVRFGSSGTEAVLAAMRLARAVTGRRLIVKFEGQYNGWADQVFVSYVPSPDQAGPIYQPSVVPGCEGLAPGAASDLAVLGWNDLETAKAFFRDHGEKVAGVLTEPICCNFTVIEPEPGYLEGLRELCDRHGALLIFDEIQTGFRLDCGGAQTRLGVRPDLTCLGKALGGGLPVSAIGGSMDVMAAISDKRVLQAGTFNSNPLGLAAAAATLRELSKPGVFEKMERLSRRLRSALIDVVEPIGGYVQGSRTMFGLGFGPGPIRNMRDGWRNDWDRSMQFKRELRLRGVYTKPTPRDIWYVSTAHCEEDIDQTIEIAMEAVAALAARLS